MRADPSTHTNGAVPPHFWLDTELNSEHCKAVQTGQASKPLPEAPVFSVDSQLANEQHSLQTPELNHASSSAEQPLFAAPLVHTYGTNDASQRFVYEKDIMIVIKT